MSVQTISIHAGPCLPAMQIADGLPQPSSLAGEGDGPDARVYLINGDGVAVAHAALWWNETPPSQEHRLGAIGGFAAGSGSEAQRLLDAACSHLSEQGCTLAVGPMNGNTWRSYRFVDETDGHAPFLLEPRNPAEYPIWWREAGFEPMAYYSSSLMALDGGESISPALKERVSRSGIVIRPLAVERYDEELEIIHSLSLKSFGGNFLYTPLDKQSFIAAYRKVKDHVDPDFVRIAGKDGVPCGFVFGIPDLEAAARGEQPALIVKTLAVDPGSRSAGLGSLLVDEIHCAAHAKGYSESIHALQHQTNTSLKITGRHEGKAFRRYVLFSKAL